MNCVFCGEFLCPTGATPGAREAAINRHVNDPGAVTVRPSWACKDLWDQRRARRAAAILDAQARGVSC